MVGWFVFFFLVILGRRLLFGPRRVNGLPSACGFVDHCAAPATSIHTCPHPPSSESRECSSAAFHLQCQMHTWEAFSILANRGADAAIPSLLNIITSCCWLLRMVNGRGKKGHLGNYVADSLFLLSSEKMMKTAASKNHTDSAGKCSPQLQEACRLPLISPGLFPEVLTFPSHLGGTISEASGVSPCATTPSLFNAGIPDLSLIQGTSALQSSFIYLFIHLFPCMVIHPTNLCVSDTEQGQWASFRWGCLPPRPVRKMDTGQVIICALSVKKKYRMNV